MAAQRRDAAESAERIWQLYADEIGIPETLPGGAAEPLPREGDPTPTARPERRAGPVVASLAAVAVVVVVAIIGVAYWSGSSRSVPATNVTATPVGAPERIARSPAAESRTGTTLPAPTPAAAPRREIVAVPPATPLRRDSTPPSVAGAAGIRAATVTFEFDSDFIDDESERILARFVAALKANPDWRVRIEGHTDARGTSDYNQALSERRAEGVRAYLQSAGIARGRLSATAYGATRPVAPNDAAGNARNRRVELHRQ